MATKKITFDPEAGVAYPCDLIMNVGADFSATFNVVDTSNTGFNFSTTNSVGLNTVSGWTGSSQMTKSTAIGSTAFPVPYIYSWYRYNSIKWIWFNYIIRINCHKKYKRR